MNQLNCKPLLLIFFIIFGISPTEAQRNRRNTTPEPAFDKSLYESVEYRLVGPFRGGRSAAVTGVPGQPNLFYFGSTGGGVWRTQDGGYTWENLSDGYFGGSIGAVAVAPSDHNVIYVGGGEKTVRGNVSSGSGMWKSEDAGKTWSFIGLPNSRHVPRIKVDPKNPDIVYAAVLGNIYKPTPDRGVYKSTDGGKNWRRVLFANENAGAVDLVIDPANARILYATTWNVRRTPYSLSSGGEGSAVWKSTDYGETWTEISKNEGFPEGTLGIMGITVSPVNNQRVWTIVEHKEKGGVYRSDDGGKTWSYQNSDRSLRQRAWYYSRIYADTKDLNTVYVLNVNYHKSTDGGKTFESSNALHGDHHDLWIAPEDPKRMIIGDDGGAQVSFDGGDNWTTYHNQPTAQFYRLTTDNHFPYRIYAAQQDNSTIRIEHRTEGFGISEENWEETAGGESAHIAVDPTNSDIVYGGNYGGFLIRINHEKGTVRGINVWPDNPMGHGAEDMKYRFQWNFPIIFSKHNPKKLYTFSNQVHLTTNEGASWEVISPDLTRNDPSKLGPSGGPITKDNTGVEYYATIFAANESPLQEGLIWVGSDDGLIHLTHDGGQNWENITPKNMPEWMMINSVEPSAFDPGTCYVAGTRYKLGDFEPYLYKTNDYGKTWTRITNGIANEHFTRVVREDPKQKGLLYAGTENGMYISYNDGASWETFQLNLPIVPITDLLVRDNNLIVATQGRSIWMIDDLTVIHQLNAAKGKNFFLFQPKDSYRMGGGSKKGSLTQGTNHPNGVMTYFYVTDTEKEVRLEYLNAQGDTIKTFSTKAKDRNRKLKAEKGHNLFVWNTVSDGAEDFPGMILWWARLSGAKAVPGNYKVRLKVGDEEQTQDFRILPAPNSEASVEEMQRQYEFINEVNATVTEAHQAIKKIRKIKTQLDAFEKQYKGNEQVKALLDKAAQMKKGFAEVEEALYQTQNRSGQDPLNFPIRLTNKLAHLNSLVGLDDFGPTAQDIAVKNELTQQIKSHLDTFNNLVDTEVNNFNSEFNKLSLNYLFIEK